MSKRSIKRVVRSQDMFGHTIHMNYNRQGPTHNNVIGGVVSIVIKIALLVFAVVRITKLVTFGDDEYSSTNGLMDVDTIPNITFSEMNLVMFHAIRKQTANGAQLFLDEEVDTYI